MTPDLLSPETLSAERLTAALQACARITPQQRVLNVIQIRSYVCTYQLTHLEAEIAGPGAQRRQIPLILKSCQPGRQSNSLEVRFYQSVQPTMPAGCVPAALHAAYDEPSRAFSLLLDDVSGHYAGAVGDPLEVPEPPVRDAMLDCLLRIQAPWWESPRFQVEPFQSRIPTEQRLRAFFETRHQALLPMLDAGDVPFDLGVMELYGGLLSTLPEAMAERLAAGRHLTLIHGDAHAGNFLVSHVLPRQALLIDWPNWRPGPPTDDVAYLAAAWPGEAQADLIASILPGYHQRLCEQAGVNPATEYTWEHWCADFTLSAANAFTYAVGLCAECPIEWASKVVVNAANLYEHAAACSPHALLSQGGRLRTSSQW